MVLPIIRKRHGTSGGSASRKKFFSNPKEEWWIGLITISLLLGVILVFIYSKQQSDERYLQSDYYLQTNNILFEIQKENGTVMFMQIRSKYLKGSKTSIEHFNASFNDSCRFAKTPDLRFEVLRSLKNEILVRIRLEGHAEADEELKDEFRKFARIFAKQQRVLAFEYRHFYNNTRGTSFFKQGEKTKGRETFDYRKRFHNGPYEYMDPEAKNVKLDILGLKEPLSAIDLLEDEEAQIKETTISPELIQREDPTEDQFIESDLSSAFNADL